VRTAELRGPFSPLLLSVGPYRGLLNTSYQQVMTDIIANATDQNFPILARQCMLQSICRLRNQNNWQIAPKIQFQNAAAP
jgi:hypothetical protein